MIADVPAIHVNSSLRNKWQKLNLCLNTKAITVIVTLFLCVFTDFKASAQAIKPCDNWLTGFITTPPKTSDGANIDAYVAGKLQADTSLKYAANCMVGLRISVNCNGEFSYDKMVYRNSISSTVQCNDLLQATEHIIDGMKLLSPGTIDHTKKDFVFNLVVRVTPKGKAKTEILY